MATAIVTGATGAIGQEICRLFAEAGVNVCLFYHSRAAEAEALAADLARKYGVRTVWHAVDLADPASIRQAFDYFYSVFGHCDYLVNNAAVSLVKPVSMMSDAEWDRVLATDLSACYHTARAVLDEMYHSGGSILNVGSMWGQLGASCEVAYSAAKAGLEGLTRALADEYAGSVRVNCLSLGYVDTPMNAHMSEEDKAAFFRENPTMRCLSAEEAAQAVYDLANEDVSGEVRRFGW